MLQTLIRRPASRSSLRPARRSSFAGVAAVESLEDRVVLSATAAIAPAAIEAPIATVTDITVTDVVVVNNQLFANTNVVGTVLGQNFTENVQIPLNLTTAVEQTQTGPVDVLNLEIGAINLDLLGLKVETSDICLDITADPAGGLLGGLVAGIANALNGPVGGLGNLTPGQLTDLTTALNGVLDEIIGSGVADAGLAAEQVGNGNGNGGRTTDILNLSLGPVELNLLGLIVELDDCNGGPVTVDITAERGAGNLLGNLLGSIAGLLDRDPGNALDALLRRADRILDGLLDDVNQELLTGNGKAKGK